MYVCIFISLCLSFSISHLSASNQSSPCSLCFRFADLFSIVSFTASYNPVWKLPAYLQNICNWFVSFTHVIFHQCSISYNSSKVCIFIRSLIHSPDLDLRLSHMNSNSSRLNHFFRIELFQSSYFYVLSDLGSLCVDLYTRQHLSVLTSLDLSYDMCCRIR